MLIRSAVGGAEDQLVGLKENVIIGRLIPAGTGFGNSPKQDIIKELNVTPLTPEHIEAEEPARASHAGEEVETAS